MANELMLLGCGPAGASAAFSPADVPGLVADWDAAAGAYAASGAGFAAASSQYLSVASNATLQTGDVDFWVAGWVYLADKSDYRVFVSKWDGTGSDSEYLLQYNQPSDRFEFKVRNAADSADASVFADTLGSPSAGAWYFVLAWHDSAGNQIAVAVNGGAADAASHSGGVRSATVPFALGANAGASFFGYLNGRLDSVAFGKSPPGGIAAVISTIASRLYNGGAGLTYADLTVQETVDWGLVSWWDLDEATGTTRVDAHGLNDLTDHNSVTRAAGVAVAAATADGTPVALLEDQSGEGNDLTQADGDKRPLLKLNVVNGLPVLRFDGTDGWLRAVFALAQPLTVFVVGRQANDTQHGYFTDGVNNISMIVSDDNTPTTGKWRIYSGAQVASSATRDTDWHAFAGVFNGASSLLSVDGDVTTGDAGSDSPGGVTLGSNGNRSGSFLSGDVARVLVYDNALSDADREAVESFLMNLYGL